MPTRARTTTRRRASGEGGAGAGLAVDTYGVTAYDPSENVRELVEASIVRLDDTAELRAQLADEKIRRLEQSIISQEKTVTLRAEYDVRLDVAEAKRIDAIRAVDVNAVAVASQRASDQATVLAAQVAQSAEALRALVATTAAAAAASQQQVVNTLSERLTRLEQAQYKGEGREAVSSPANEQLIAEVQRLTAAQSNLSGKGQGANALWGVIVALVMAGFALFQTLNK